MVSTSGRRPPSRAMKALSSAQERSTIELNLMLEYCCHRFLAAVETENSTHLKIWGDAALAILSALDGGKEHCRKGPQWIESVVNQEICRGDLLITLEMCLLSTSALQKLCKPLSKRDRFKLCRELYRNIRNHLKYLLNRSPKLVSEDIEMLLRDKRRFTNDMEDPQIKLEELGDAVKIFVGKYRTSLGSPYLQNHCQKLLDSQTEFVAWLACAADAWRTRHCVSSAPGSPKSPPTKRPSLETVSHCKTDDTSVQIFEKQPGLIRRKRKRAPESSPPPVATTDDADTPAPPPPKKKTKRRAMFSQVDKDLYSDIKGTIAKDDDDADGTSLALKSSKVESAGGLYDTSKSNLKRFWTKDEEIMLRDGVRRFGQGHWRDILQHYNFHGRTNVDLKDKWRNLRKNLDTL